MIWALFSVKERRNFWILIAIVCLSAAAAVLMIVSIMPFLTVLSNPERIQESKALSAAYEFGGFSNDRDFLMALGIGSIFVIVFSNVLQLLKVYALSRFGAMRVYSISTRLLERYLRQPYMFYINKHSGELGKQLLSESQQVVDLAIKPAIEALAALITVLLIVLLLLYFEPVISLSAFGSIGAVYGLLILFSKKMSKNQGEIRKQSNTECFKFANDALTGIKDLKVLGRERFYFDRFSRPAFKMAQSQMKIGLITQSPQYVIHAVMFAGIIVLCLVLLGRAGLDGGGLEDIIPTIGLMAFAGQRILPEVARLFRSVTMLGYSGPAVETVHADLVEGETGEELPFQNPDPLRLKEVLSFESVSFQYPGAEKASLDDVSFNISAGDRIGIVGSTGSGKTTLANLLLGLLEPSTGHLKVDGQSIIAGNRRSWQRSIGYVPQEIFLTDLSVRENIAFGVPQSEIDETRVIEAARIARIHDFILDEMDNGYETIVGERGIRLSGGQRQRIGIARALYNNADLILFDEATSALDNATEQDVMRAIDALPDEKTLLMIAHRLTTLRGCDRILVLKLGKVVGFDTWAALERDCEEFRKIAQGVQAV